MDRTRTDRSLAALLAAAAVLVVALPTHAQEGGGDNPVTTTVRRNLDRYGAWLVAGAREMPADKYSYKPTDGVRTFGEELKHVASGNDHLCAAISGMEAPKREDVSTTDKQGLVDLLASSFDFCRKALGSVDDSKLAEPVPFFGGNKVPRATAMMALPIDWADHYGHQALYLRMNGMTPPSARGNGM
ncbi:MAG TPA: DinB family protein [Gemmatimonadota bacterium]|nr:DinB family protein [Gemmatimonadota bacterium]